ncbi:MAG: DUF3574 domain-containing protein [Bernardetiaceae bacterium]
MASFQSILCLSLLALASCQMPVGKTYQKTELYFGTQRPDSTFVTAVEWQAFVDQEIAPCFQDGFTVVDALGQWLHRSAGVQREESKLLIVVYPLRGRGAGIDLDSIRARYCRRFHQETVLRMDSRVRVDF